MHLPDQFDELDEMLESKPKKTTTTTVYENDGKGINVCLCVVALTVLAAIINSLTHNNWVSQGINLNLFFVEFLMLCRELKEDNK